MDGAAGEQLKCHKCSCPKRRRSL